MILDPRAEDLHPPGWERAESCGWTLAGANGIVGFLHPEGVYDDSKGGVLRKAVYHRLRGHFQFINELQLFSDAVKGNETDEVSA